MLCTGNDSLVCVCDLQEVFRSIEDIHGLMSMVKMTPKPQMMAIYYVKLTKIFWVSDSHLYHAYAWYKLCNLQKSYNKNLMTKDLQLMASSVLLATLAVTSYDCKHGAHHFELEMEKDRNIWMANLLGFTLDPKKDSLEVVSACSAQYAQTSFCAFACQMFVVVFIFDILFCRTALMHVFLCSAV
jgi:translation initiation factor 3 subunit A